MNWNFFRTFVVFAVASVCFGCGSTEFPEVSGKVTFDGEPVSGVRLVFNPVAGDTPDPGPYSTAVTDESGVFVLETRDKKPGAVVGLHTVGFDWQDIRSYTMRNLEKALAESKGIPEEEAKIKAKIADVKQKLASRPKLKAGLQTEFTVPDGGTDSANFELTEF